MGPAAFHPIVPPSACGTPPQRSRHGSRISIPEALARTKFYVDHLTLPADSELPPALADFFELLGRPAQQAQFARLEALGLNTESDLERFVGRRVVESSPDA